MCGLFFFSFSIFLFLSNFNASHGHAIVNCISNTCADPGALNSEAPSKVPDSIFDSVFLRHLRVQRIIQSLSKLIRSSWSRLRCGNFTKLEATCVRFPLLLGFARMEHEEISFSCSITASGTCQSQQNTDMCKNAEMKLDRKRR